MTGVQLAGEPVTMSSAGDLAVSRGRFRLENPGTEAVRAAVDAAFVDVGGRRHRVEPASVFDSGRETGHDPGGFDVAPGTTTFWLSFPPVADQARRRGADQRGAAPGRRGRDARSELAGHARAADSAPLITGSGVAAAGRRGNSVYENEIRKSIASTSDHTPATLTRT